MRPCRCRSFRHCASAMTARRQAWNESVRPMKGTQSLGPSCASAAALAWVMALVGCGANQQLGQVDGVVTLDGQPLGNVLVVFVPDGGRPVVRSAGVSDSAGKFQLKTEEG